MIKHWIQKKVKALNAQTAEQLTNQFLYIHRAEYLGICAQNCGIQGISSEKYCDNEVIVSLTTYGKRLYDVYLAIESIMQQTLKPNRLILWLSDEMKSIDMPQVLLNQQKRGLEIRFCKDIKSYKKLIPALQNFPSATVITIDDDQIYHFDMIENFINAHKINSKMIFSARIHRMKLIGKNKLEKYAKWTHLYEGLDVSPLNFPTGVGGVLYPPNCFSEEVFSEKTFYTICEYADDIWFKAMALLNGVMSQKIFTHNKSGTDFLGIDTGQDSALFHINVYKGRNDIQLKAVFDKYNLYEKLLETG